MEVGFPRSGAVSRRNQNMAMVGSVLGPVISSAVRQAVRQAGSAAYEYGKRKLSEASSSSSNKKAKNKVVKKKNMTNGYKKGVRRTGKGYKKGKGPMKKKFDDFLRTGHETCVVHGGVVSDAESVLVGHGAPAFTLLRTICGALVRKLFARGGMTYNDEFELTSIPMDQMRLDYEFRTDWEGASSGRNILFVAPCSYATVIDDWVTDIITALAGGAYSDFIMVRMALFPIGTSPLIKWVRMDLAGAKVQFKVRNSVVLQNRTLGNAATDKESTDVTRNPIRGKLYCIRNSSFRTKTVIVGGGANAGAHLSPETGFQSRTNFGSINGVRQAGDILGLKFSKNVFLNPGETMRSFVGNEGTISIYLFFRKLLKYLRTTSVVNRLTDGDLIYFGDSKWYEFQKYCDTNTGTSNVDLGYDVTTVVGCKIIGAPNPRLYRRVKAV